MKHLVFIVSLLYSVIGFSQIQTDSIFTLEEYLGYVKKYHPIVKQARLITSEGEAKLLKARGAFDPKIEVDYSQKTFKGTEYYDKLNAAFKIPTWYGIELKANYENNEGNYLNPEYKVPEDGLYSAGVSMSLAKGFLTNTRMATLKQAKIYNQIARAKQELLVNDILYEAVDAYFLWLKYFQELNLYTDYRENAQMRLQNVITSFEAGDKPAIDTLEAGINLKNRLLELEKAKINFAKSTFVLSNYLWLENNLPLELNTNIVPDLNTVNSIDLVLNSSLLNIDEAFLENHPKIQALQLEKEQLAIDKRLKTNNLLPQVDLQYNFLTPEYDQLNSFAFNNYKSGLQVSLPLFLRKERGDLKLAKIKLQDIDFDISATKVNLKNKISATQKEIESYQNQNAIAQNLVTDYKELVHAEERKFYLGEGSLFLINYREAKLIETNLKQIEIIKKLLEAKSEFARILTRLN